MYGFSITCFVHTAKAPLNFLVNEIKSSLIEYIYSNCAKHKFPLTGGTNMLGGVQIMVESQNCDQQARGSTPKNIKETQHSYS